MDAVGLVERGVRGHAVEQERHERDAGLPRHVGKGGGELAGVRRRRSSGAPHARQEDAGAGGREAARRCAEVVPHARQALAPQAVVGAERDDDDLRARAQHPVHAAKAAGRRVAAHARVHDPVGVALARAAAASSSAGHASSLRHADTPP